MSATVNKENSVLKPVPLLKIEDFESASGINDLQNSKEEPELETFHQKFLRSRLDQARDYPLPVSIVDIWQSGSIVPLLTLKSFSLWQGKQKSKKTTALALMVASVISGRIDDLEGVRFEGSLEGSVLFFDNEQGESYAARTMKLILKLAGLDTSARFIYCDLREFSPTERKKIIEAGIIATPDAKLVVIDGLVDLLTDFMDAGEGHLTITEILKLCSVHNIHVAGVLHQNKADKNARAHVGTISSQKCEIEITTEVDPDDKSRSIVSCVNSRGIPFEPFAIRWDKGSLPCICQDWNIITNSDSKANKNYDFNKDIATMVFKPFIALSNKDAVEGIMNAAKKSESTAKRILKDYLGWHWVVKGEDGNYRLNEDKGSRVHEGSNRVHEPVQ